MHPIPGDIRNHRSTPGSVRSTHARWRHHRWTLLLAAAVLCTAACSSASLPSDGPHTVAPERISAVTETARPSPAPPSGTVIPGEGITGAAAQQLQQSVDAGHQPWRLDEVAVVRSFVSTRFGWSDPTITYGRDHVAVVTGPDGDRVSLHLVQPARRDDGGVWVVESGNRL